MKKKIQILFITHYGRIILSCIIIAGAGSMIHDAGTLAELIRHPETYPEHDYWEYLTIFGVACLIASFAYFIIDGIRDIRKRKKLYGK